MGLFFPFVGLSVHNGASTVGACLERRLPVDASLGPGRAGTIVSDTIVRGRRLRAASVLAQLCPAGRATTVEGRTQWCGDGGCPQPPSPHHSVRATTVGGGKGGLVSFVQSRRTQGRTTPTSYALKGIRGTICRGLFILSVLFTSARFAHCACAPL